MAVLRSNVMSRKSTIDKRTSTTLSDHVWKFKKKHINFNIKWENFKIKKVKPFSPGDKVCKRCSQERLTLLRSAPFLNYKKNVWTLHA